MQYDLPTLLGTATGEHDAQLFVCDASRFQNWPACIALCRPRDEYWLLAGQGSVHPSPATLFKPDRAVESERSIEDAERSKSCNGALGSCTGSSIGRPSNRQPDREKGKEFPHTSTQMPPRCPAGHYHLRHMEAAPPNFE